jgi:hypothetical protein
MKEICGVLIFNGTPHAITFDTPDGCVEVESDEVINATVCERDANGIAPLGQQAAAERPEFVTPTFVGNDEGWVIINRVNMAHPTALIIGSIIAAQAYPRHVVAMVPAPGFERVPPAEKRMRIDKFTVFAH